MGNNKKGKQTIDTGGGTFIGGNLSMGDSSKFVGRDDYSQSGLNGEEVKKLFETLYAKVDQHSNLSNDEKTDLNGEIDELRSELVKKDQANESFLLRRLRNIGRMAPEILEVTLAIITNPIAGFGVIAKKIAVKAKQATA